MAQMEPHEMLWAVSFLKMAVRIVGIPIKWVRQNSRFWDVRITELRTTRITEDGKVRVL
jgi:hypothetical protein